MSENASKGTPLLTLAGSLGAILIFVLVIYLAYLPNRPEPIDTAVAAERQAKADEARAAGAAKLSSYVVSETGAVQIPIDAAIERVLKGYNQ